MDSGGEGRKERLVRKGKGREEGGVWKVEERSENRDGEVKGNVTGAAKRKEGGGKLRKRIDACTYHSSDQSSSTS